MKEEITIGEVRELLESRDIMLMAEKVAPAILGLLGSLAADPKFGPPIQAFLSKAGEIAGPLIEDLGGY